MNEGQITELRADYDVRSVLAARLINSLKEQITTLVDQHDIALAVPIETRIKDWESVREKIERKGRQEEGLNAINDLAGIRLITLFQRDVEKLDELIRTTLDVTEAEDTSGRLHDAQFGYRSNHYVCRIPNAWQSIPSYRGLGNICAELQVRTLPQHMWAAASHKLQYKHEDSAPPRLRRAINRVSAILETVDLEFTRMLEERERYVEDQEIGANKEELLNVDNLSALLTEIFPAENRGDDEPYDELLTQLKSMGITHRSSLKAILTSGRKEALESDKSNVASRLADDDEPITARLKRGVYFKHVGLARAALRAVNGPLPGDSNGILKG